MTVIRTFLTLSTIFTIFTVSSALHLGRQAGRGRGGKWNLDSTFGLGSGRDGLRQHEDERLNAIIATDNYIDDMQNKIEDLEELKAEVLEELKDDEDYEGSGRFDYHDNKYYM